MNSKCTVMLCLMLLICACTQDNKQPGYEIKMLTDMKESVAIEAFGPTMQSPVAETIHREAILAMSEKNPIAFEPQALQRGQKVYENFCLVCHGATGEGDGPLIPKYPNPPSLHSQRLLALKPVDFYKIITEGKRDMPAHAGQISEEDRWKLIYYIEKIQGKRQ